MASQFNGALLSGPLLVMCRFHIPLTKTQHRERKAFLNTLPHWKKPDGDNLEKFLFDCCSRIVWQDDAQVAWMIRSKVWTNEPEGWTDFFVTEIPETTLNLDELLKTIWNVLK